MTSFALRTRHNALGQGMAAVMLAAALGGAAEAGIVNTFGLTTVSVWESTGPFTAYNFPHNVGPMVNQIGVGNLGPGNFDFSPLANENYDVFYSNANGTFNPTGFYVTVEAVYPPGLPSGGGLNLGAVDLIIGGSPLRADILVSWVGLGNNYIPGSEVLAVDADNFPLAPTTDTTMGNTGPNPTQHLRVTVTWSSLIPEPSSFVLGAIGLLGMLTRKRNSTSA